MNAEFRTPNWEATGRIWFPVGGALRPDWFVILMPFCADLLVLKFLGFFISIVTNFAEFIVKQPFAV
ncbi:MAG: hypothetical protein JJT75_05215, partial [Opitutales bacterium]|nr:hypothetical protein [Opitutales bacterium]